MHFFPNFWGLSLSDLPASIRVSGSPWVQGAGQSGNAFECLQADDFSPGGELFSCLHPSFQPGACDWGMLCAAQCHLSREALARRAHHAHAPWCLLAAEALPCPELWGPSTPAQVIVRRGNLISLLPGAGTDSTRGDKPLFLYERWVAPGGCCTVGWVPFSFAGAAPMSKHQVRFSPLIAQQCWESPACTSGFC